MLLLEDRLDRWLKIVKFLEGFGWRESRLGRMRIEHFSEVFIPGVFVGGILFICVRIDPGVFLILS